MSQKISAMTNASTPLTGAELVPIVQGGVNKKATVLELNVVNSLQYQGVWDANTNTPALTSSVGTAGYYYIVNTAGTTTLNGISSWAVGDWVVFSNAGTWQKIGGGTQSSIAISDDDTSATTYNLLMTGLTSGYMATGYVDGGDLTYTPSTGNLAVTNLTVNGGIDFSGGATNALYFGAGANRVTLANYNAGGILMFETNGGAYAGSFRADGVFESYFQIKTQAVAVASLPAASTVGAGGRSFVTDATSSTFNALAVGGGSNAVPVFSDGTNWKIG